MATYRDIREVFLLALMDHLDHDRMSNANERSRVGRLLIAVQGRMDESTAFRDLTVDSEYSVVGTDRDPKVVAGRRRYPDLIIHQRGNPSRNVLACEVKRREVSRPRAGPDRGDARKIAEMIGLQPGLPPGIRPYEFGACVNLAEDGARVWWWGSREADGFSTNGWPVLDIVR